MGAEEQLTNSGAVLAAMAEFDELGRQAFLKKYEIGAARRYWVVSEGRRYDAKAIIGAARGYQYPERGPLKTSEFAGNEKSVKELLEGLGFDVETADELRYSKRALYHLHRRARSQQLSSGPSKRNMKIQGHQPDVLLPAARRLGAIWYFHGTGPGPRVQG